jgi:spermidine synthase
VEAYPGARREAEEPTPVGWLVQVDAPAFHYAPGLSLAFRGAFPRQSALFVDGELAGASSRWRRDEEIESLVERLPTASPYALGGHHRVLVVGAGEGLEVLNAMAHGATEITAVELHPGLARRAAEQRPVGASPPARWRVGDARAYLARTRERFDLITMGAGGAFGTAAAGVHSLDEDFLHTIEAYELYLNRLADGGILSVTRWLAGPPRESVRTILTACEALRRVRPGALPRALIVMRSWATVTILVKPAGFSPGEIARIRAWAAARAFDLDWYPGTAGPPRPVFNITDAPVFHDAARAGVSGAGPAAAFAKAYAFLVSPVPDARPYTRHFLKPRFLAALLRPDRSSYLPLAEWGLVALLATLAWSVLLAALLLLVPALLGRLRGASYGGRRLITYFALLGFAYLAAEIAAIQQLCLLLGHPVYAVAATLAGLLVGSGLGSAACDRISPRALPGALGGLLLLLLGEALLLLPVARAVQSAPLAVRAAVALAALAPPAVLMGVPFPLGLRALALGQSHRVAWAWAANGFASVVAAPLSALIALEWGSRALFLYAAGGYAAALLLAAGATGRGEGSGG